MKASDPASAYPIHYFLDGKVLLAQSADGYRAGMDAVLLGALAAHLGGASGLDVGCGAGAVMAMGQARAPKMAWAGAEIDSEMAGLARENMTRNNFEADMFCADILTAPAEEIGTFDLVVSNPPFFDDEVSIRPPSEARKQAWIIGAPLKNWIKAMRKLASPKGKIALIHRPDRLADILAAFGKGMGGVTILPIHARADQSAKRILVWATKGSRGPITILPALVIGGADGARFSEQYEEIAKGGPLFG